jgi:predicted nuclease of predicted toxin-antitoxin system
MRVKLDENVPEDLAPDLEALGHHTDTALSEQLGGSADEELWRATQAGHRFLVTQDLDFSDLRTLVSGDHGGVMLVRLHGA